MSVSTKDPAIKVDVSSESLSSFAGHSEIEAMLDEAFASQKAEFLKSIDDNILEAHHRVTFDKSQPL